MYRTNVQSDKHVSRAANCHLFVTTPAAGSVCWQPRLIRRYVLVAAPAQTHSCVQWPVVCMQHSQACSGTGYSASEPAHSAPNHRLQSMLNKLIPELKACADTLLDLEVWKDEQKWKDKNADNFDDNDFVSPFWHMSLDDDPNTDKIMIFHRSLKNMVKIIVDVIQYQKDSQTHDPSDPASKHTDEWESLKEYLMHLELTLHEHVRNPSTGWLTNSVTFFMLAHETTWKNWIKGCIDNDRLYKIWHFFAKRMASFCMFFISILNYLSTNEESWTTCVQKILDFCHHAAFMTHILDKLHKLDNMPEAKIRTFVKDIQDTFEIPSWLRIDAERVELEKVKRFGKDLLIAPSTGELEKLYHDNRLAPSTGGLQKLYHDNRFALRMCIHAMEDQNNIAESDRTEINYSLLNDEENLMLYARKYTPLPIVEDLENMNRGTLEATIIRMRRDLCMLPTERPNLEEFSDHDLVSYGEALLVEYPSEKFPSQLDPIDHALIKRLASAVNLPDENLQNILDMPTRNSREFNKRYLEVKNLKRSYHAISFYSITESKIGVKRWSGLNEYRICLQTGIWNDAPEGTLDLTICRYNGEHSLQPRNIDVRFSLTTKCVEETRERQNVTQFIQVTFGYIDSYGDLYCLLHVHEPGEDTDRAKQNSRKSKSYYIPYTHTQEPTYNQEEKLRNFLDKCATKIGQPFPFETIKQSLDRQMYRACDPILRKERITRQVLIEAFSGNEDVVNKIMAYTKVTD